jgi:hypothetical protein
VFSTLFPSSALLPATAATCFWLSIPCSTALSMALASVRRLPTICSICLSRATIAFALCDAVSESPRTLVPTPAIESVICTIAPELLRTASRCAWLRESMCALVSPSLRVTSRTATAVLPSCLMMVCMRPSVRSMVPPNSTNSSA